MSNFMSLGREKGIYREKQNCWKLLYWSLGGAKGMYESSLIIAQGIQSNCKHFVKDYQPAAKHVGTSSMTSAEHLAT